LVGVETKSDDYNGYKTETKVTQPEFKKLFDKYFDEIRRFIYYRSGDEALSTDVAQEAFIRLWEKRANITNDNIKGLLYKMASDNFVSQTRRQKVFQGITLKLGENGNGESPENILEHHELKIMIEKALENLPENQRVVFLMSRHEELKYNEIAERLDISVKAVEKRMSVALNTLRKVLNYK